MGSKKGRRGIPSGLSLNRSFNLCEGCLLKSKVTIRDARTGRVERTIDCKTNCKRRKQKTHYGVTNVPIQAASARIIHKAIIEKLEEEGIDYES